MTNPTSNFGWQMPTSTDLVTDLPADFETFGQAVDTSLADLKGGTTGQILSKASNTSMDFTWVTTDDANAIQNSIVDAKGDIVAASANDTPARLAVGNNGETLVADSSTSTGLRYTAGTVNENPVLNSAFQVWQRGTSIAIANASTTYIPDRWSGYRSATGSTVSRQTTNDTTNLPFIQYCARVQRDSGNTNTSAINFAQSFESANAIPYAGKAITLSFYARAGANFSAASSQLGVQFYTGTGTDQNVHTGYTGSVLLLNSAATLTTTWQRFTYTMTIASTATELAPYLTYTPVGTAGAADFYELTGVQIDVGSVALPFRTNGATIQGELAACQRYYLQSSLGAYYVTGSATTTTDVVFAYPLPVQMRTTPSASMSAVGDFLLIGAANKTFTSINNNSTAGSTAVSSFYTSGSSGLTAGYSYTLYSVTGSIRFSAEL